MRHIKSFISLTEAIKLADARKATKIFIDSGGKERYNEIFQGKNRLYYDLDETFNKSYIYNPLENQVKTALNNSGYDIIDYSKGLASKRGDDKNTFKIQKILNKIGELDLRNRMDADPLRSSSTKKDKMIVISRHGIDIAGQSTGRDWTSCKSIKIDSRGTPQGINAKYVWTEIAQGSLVAYIITPDDINIEKPIARIIIGVYINDKDPKDFILYPDASVYGNYSKKDFMDFVINWCIDANKKISPKNEGVYNLSDKCYVDKIRKVNVSDNPLGNIRGYLGLDSPDYVNISRNSIGEIKDIFKYIEAQESDLKPEIIFNYLKKINNSITPDVYAEFINENDYPYIEKYLNKYPEFFINYIAMLDYNLISDKNKENQIRNSIKSYFLEIGGPDYIDGFKALSEMDGADIPLAFIRWILE
jgi:hypothetical protein